MLFRRFLAVRFLGQRARTGGAERCWAIGAAAILAVAEGLILDYGASSVEIDVEVRRPLQFLRARTEVGRATESVVAGGGDVERRRHPRHLVVRPDERPLLAAETLRAIVHRSTRTA